MFSNKSYCFRYQSYFLTISYRYRFNITDQSSISILQWLWYFVQFWFRHLLQKNRDDYLLINNQKKTHVRLLHRAVIPAIIAQVKFMPVWRNVIKKGLKANQPIKIVHIWLVCCKLYSGEAQYKIIKLECETSVKLLGIWVDNIYFWSTWFSK